MRQTYPEMIRFRAPENFSALIAEAASENYQSISDYMRQLVLTEIGKRQASLILANGSDRGRARSKLRLQAAA